MVVHLSLTSCGLLLGSPKTLCTRCRDGVNVLCCCFHLVWLVFEGSIPTCTCFHSENFFVTCVEWTPVVGWVQNETLTVNSHKETVQFQQTMLHNGDNHHHGNRTFFPHCSEGRGAHYSRQVQWLLDLQTHFWNRLRDLVPIYIEHSIVSNCSFVATFSQLTRTGMMATLQYYVKISKRDEIIYQA